MLITCFQCRQQLNVSDESAGKRVRCPHCSYVIVAPAKSKPTAEGAIEPAAPAVALPSMDLDGDGPPPQRPSKVPVQSVPPTPLPAVVMDKPRKAEPKEEEAPPPSVERGRRRRPASGPPATPTRSSAGKVLAILAVIAALGIGVVVGAFAMHESNNHQPQPFFPPVAFNPQPQPFMPEFNGPPGMQPFDPNRQRPPAFIPGPQLTWYDYRDPNRMFKVLLPRPDAPIKQMIQNHEWTGQGSHQGEWNFSILHRSIPDNEFRAMPAQAHVNDIENGLINAFNARVNFSGPRALLGGVSGREWDFSTPDGRKLFAQCCLVPTGERCHQFLLIAAAPMNVDRFHATVSTFFHSFVLLRGIEPTNAPLGQMVYEEIDDMNIKNDRRDNEFLSLAVHPQKDIVVAGTTSGHVCLTGNLGFKFALGDNKGIEQIAISPDGKWLAASTGAMIHVWQDWDGGALVPLLPTKGGTSAPARRCAFSKNHLFVAARNSIKAFDLNTAKWVTNLDLGDMNVQGVAVTPDESILAIHDEKTIALWDWPGKKELAHLDAHEAAITTAVFSPDGKTLASAGADRIIKLWDVETRTESAALKQHAWTVSALAFTPDGKRLASGGLDGMLLFWDIQQAKPRMIWAQANRFPVRGVAFDGGNKHCYMTCKQALGEYMKEASQYRRQVRKIAKNEIKANPVQAEKIVAQHAGLHLPTSFGAALISRDAHTIVTTSDRQRHFDFRPQMQGQPQEPQLFFTRFWDGATARQRHSIDAFATGQLSPDGNWFAYMIPGQNAINVLDVATRRSSGPLGAVPPNFVPHMFFAADSKYLWVESKDELIQYEMPAVQQDKPKKFVNPAPVVHEKRRLKFKDSPDVGFARLTLSLDLQGFLLDDATFGAGLRKRTWRDCTDGREIAVPKPPPGERSKFVRLRFPEDDADLVEVSDLTSGITRAVGRHAEVSVMGTIHPSGKIAASVASMHRHLLKIHFFDVDKSMPILTLPDVDARHAVDIRFSSDGRYFAYVSNAGWSRILPTDWLLERKVQLACDPNEVAAP